MLAPQLSTNPILAALECYAINDITKRIYNLGTAVVEELQDSFQTINMRSASTTTLIVNNALFLVSTNYFNHRMVLNAASGITLYGATANKTREWRTWYKDLRFTLEENTRIFQENVANLTGDFTRQLQEFSQNNTALLKENEDFAANNGKLNEQVQKLQQEKEDFAANNVKLNEQNNQLEKCISTFAALLEKASATPDLLGQSVRAILDDFTQENQSANGSILETINNLDQNQLCLILELQELRKEIARLNNFITGAITSSRVQLVYQDTLLIGSGNA